MPYPAFSEVSVAVRVLVGLVFLTAAVGKMRHWSILRGVVANYRLLPQWLEAAVTYALPPVEALLGAALLLGQMAPWAAAGAASLLLLFALAMGINLRRGRRHIDCGCFQSALKQPLSWTLVIRNTVLASLLAIPLLSQSRTGDLAAILLGALAGGVMFLILQSLSILWSIVPAWRLRGAAGAAR